MEEKIAQGRIQKPLAMSGHEIKHAWFWPRMGQWFATDGMHRDPITTCSPSDAIITETGTAEFGLLDVALPSRSTMLGQVLWGSIGWSVGSCLGAALAARESKRSERRVVLFVGDGSLQLVSRYLIHVTADEQTLQEIGTMLRHDLHPYIFILNNDGYEIERQIHGWDAKYNDIQSYDHQLILPMFAGKKVKVGWPTCADLADGQVAHESLEVHTPAELDALLQKADFNKPDKIRVIEVYMPRGDAPETLVKQAKLTAEANAKA